MTLKDARRLQKLHEFAIQEEARGILLADDSGFGAVISEAVKDAGEGDQTADPGKHGDALDTKTR